MVKSIGSVLALNGPALEMRPTIFALFKVIRIEYHTRDVLKTIRLRVHDSYRLELEFGAVHERLGDLGQREPYGDPTSDPEDQQNDRSNPPFSIAPPAASLVRLSMDGRAFGLPRVRRAELGFHVVMGHATKIGNRFHGPILALIGWRGTHGQSLIASAGIVVTVFLVVGTVTMLVKFGRAGRRV